MCRPEYRACQSCLTSASSPVRRQLDLDNVANPFQCYSFFTLTRHSVQHSAYVVSTIGEQRNRTTQKESLCYTGPAAYKAWFSTQYATSVSISFCSLSFGCFECRRWSIPVGQLNTVFGSLFQGRPGVMCDGCVSDRQGTYRAGVRLNDDTQIVHALLQMFTATEIALGDAENIMLLMMFL